MNDAQSRLASALADRYRIDREIGAGGMATVYLAEDLKHLRKVAIKVLRPELGALIGAQRFLTEIRTTANLQHPHILGLIDSGEVAGLLYYVMPYIDGESLRARLNRERQLSVEDATRIATEVASALDYAHRHGVVHRDIKPENILLQDGTALVADFGIALAVSAAGADRMTETGLSLGTPAYMSPEQAMAEREVTGKSDVYSLGAVTYEMLAGEPPFTGANAQAVLSRMLVEDPRPLRTLRKTVPPAAEDAVLCALQKLPADRWNTAGEFALALRSESPTLRTAVRLKAPAGQDRESRRTRSIPGTVALAAGILVAGAAAGWMLQREAAPLVVQSNLIGVELAESSMQLSPDGTLLAILRPDSTGRTRLYLRRLSELEEKPVPGTDGVLSVFFSPDSKRLGLFDGSSLRIGQLSGPFDTTVASGVTWDVRSPSWGPGDYIYFTNRDGAMARIAAGGGKVDTMLRIDAREGFLGRYDALPGGGGVLLTTLGQHGNAVAVLDLKTRTVTELAKGQSPHYASGYVVFAGPDGALFALPFNERRLAATGPPRVLGPRVQIFTFGAASFTVSQTGLLAYQAAGAGGGVEGQLLVSLGTNGTEQRLKVPPADFQAVAVSPSGRQLAIESNVARLPAGGRIVVMGLGDSLPTPLLSEGLARYPAWTPDGRRIAYSRLLDDQRDIVWQPADGSGAAEPLFVRQGSQWEVTFTPDERWIVYREGDASRNEALLLRYRPLRGGSDTDDKPFPHLRGINARSPTLSPDGHWLAFVADQSGKPEVFVRPFPPDSAGGIWQVTTDGGTEPQWAARGREIYYRLGGAFWSATIGTRPTFRVISRRRLFVAPALFALPFHPQYGVLPDGSVIATRAVASGSESLTVLVQNWPAALLKDAH